MRRIAAGLIIVLAASSVHAEPAPLTEEQRTAIAKLANETKAEADRLKTLLERKQEELTACYSKYELDVEKADKLEGEVIDLQRKMLANYRKMQVELRKLVGEERFVVLNKRLENMLKKPKN